MSALPEERQETALERAQRRRDEALARPIVIRCQDCLWEQEGPVLEARRAWAEHRRDEHDDPSGMESVERIAKPLTMREIKHGGRKTKHSPRCKQDGCSVTAVHTSGLCHEHELRRTHERKERSAMPHRTCEEVAGCTNQTVSDRGVYARVCAEHKDLVTQRRRQAGLGIGSTPDPERHAGKRPLAAVPPPAPEPEPVEPDGRQAVDKNAPDSAPSLVELAERVDTLSTRRRAMLAELDALEVELRAAVADTQKALSACEIEDVA